MHRAGVVDDRFPDPVGPSGHGAHRAADAGPDRRRHHAGLSDRLHAHGHGRAVHLPGLFHAARGRRARGPPDAGPDGAAHVRHHDQRLADLGAAVRVHGLSGGASQPDRTAVPLHASGAGAPARRAGRGHPDHLRHLRHRHRHRRRGGHADGPAGHAGHAQGRLQRAPDRGLDHGRRLPGHPDPAFGHADRLRRDHRRVGGATVRRRVLSGHHAGGPVRAVRHGRGQAAPGHGAAAVQGGTPYPLAAWRRSAAPARPSPCRARAAGRAVQAPRSASDRQLPGAQPDAGGRAAGGLRADHRGHLRHLDRAAGRLRDPG
ncbi:Uncharacterised protein [Bordetella pertussis]|nr:Uncharacterised protein [Bordetella pertussis]CFM02354.1 Uncharacterised protein [Bordetella pertussis]CFM20027.1 Uncharacterised protein [Bordetella pertussis]CFM62182.1 Uncharacterised protein [Bordetella pertussis]CFN42943.1 Uncharacterised protein [Bordetella pertussis]